MTSTTSLRASFISTAFIAFALTLAAGCGDDDGGGTTTDGGAGDAGTDAPAACGAVGSGCSGGGGCDDELSCYQGGEGGFCAPERADCGGFAGAECQDESHLCVLLANDTLGACLTAGERDCVCARSPETVQGCED
jgi:hypothetical protein